MSIRTGCLLASLMPLLVTLGCGGDDTPVPVHGMLKVDGQPIAGAAVQFLPLSEEGRMAFAETKADGTFDLMTFVENDGALPGEYKVTILWEEPPPLWTQYRAEAPMREELKRKYYAEGGDKRPKRESPVPAIYGESATTPLVQKVPVPKGVVEFDLKSKSQ